MGRPDLPGRRILTPWGTQYHNFGLLALTVDDDGTATGQIVDTVAFMWLRDHRFPRRSISTTDEQAAVTETWVHPADVANAQHAPGACIAIGTRVRNCRSSYTPPESDPDGEGVLWLVDHDSGSWARLHHDPDSDGPYRVYPAEGRAPHQGWKQTQREGSETHVAIDVAGL